jgi:shikimate 5-dehydrogenase
MTLKAALLGKDITNSISPQVHGFLFDIVNKKVGSSFKGIDYSLAECSD